MPQHRITGTWSDPIALEARDIVQNQTEFLIELCPQDPATDPTSLRLPEITGSIQVDHAMTGRARCLNGSGILVVVRGF